MLTPMADLTLTIRLVSPMFYFKKFNITSGDICYGEGFSSVCSRTVLLDNLESVLVTEISGSAYFDIDFVGLSLKYILESSAVSSKLG